MDPNIEYWAPQSLIWDAAWGWPGLYLSQNMGAASMPARWPSSRSCRSGSSAASPGRARSASSPSPRRWCCSTRSAATRPAFHLMYDLMPGVALYRRPADATFVLVALVAVIAGYLVHRWLTGTVPPATRLQRALEIACPLVADRRARWRSPIRSSASARCWFRSATAIVFTAAAVAVLVLARRLDARWPVAAAGADRGVHGRGPRLEQRSARLDRAAAASISRRCVPTPATRPCGCSRRGSPPPRRPTGATASS